MDDSQLARYARQILLPEIDIEGQQRLNASTIMIIGIGGLGNVAAMALAGAGIGTLHLWDGDEVESSNLHRQPLFDQDDIGGNKAQAAARQLKALNPDCLINCHEHFTELSQGLAIAQQCDLILDCTDNRQTRLLVNQLAVQTNTPLIIGAAIRFEGQLITLLNQGGPCYECVSAQMTISDVACRDVGILNTQVMIIGLYQAHVALKHLFDVKPIADGQLLLMDGKQDDWQRFVITKSENCPTCHIDKVN